MAHRSLYLLAPLAVASLVSAQAAPGLRMFAPHGTSDTFLVDNQNNIVHTWPGTLPPGNGTYVEPDGTLLRTEQLPGAPQIGGRGGGLTRVGFDGTVLWDFELANDEQWAHHDIALMPNGNVLMIVWDRMTAADAIAAGRDPSLLLSPDWLPDGIVEVQQTGPTTGEIVWEWHFMDHVIQDFDPTKANFGVVADHPERLDINYPRNVLTNGEWNHCNSIDYDPVRDLIVLNSPFQNELWIIDHSTTTEEAAGHTGGTYGRGGDILYRWGNPAAYRAGTEADQKLFFQHGTNFIDEGLRGAGNLLIFNNRAGTPQGLDHSAVVELDLPGTFFLMPGQAFGPAGFAWEWTAPVKTDFFSRNVSNAERLPNGNTVVCAGNPPNMFEIDMQDNVVWTFQPNVPSLVFQVSYIDNMLWESAREVSLSAGGTVDFDLVAGAEFAGDRYLVLGSTAGTSPGIHVHGAHLPLNYDSYFLTTLTSANQYPFGNTAGTLDSSGSASASFTMPAGILPPEAAGLEFDHAFVIFDVQTSTFVRASNSVPLTWVP